MAGDRDWTRIFHVLLIVVFVFGSVLLLNLPGLVTGDVVLENALNASIATGWSIALIALAVVAAGFYFLKKR
jgi:hypothetical protein